MNYVHSIGLLLAMLGTAIVRADPPPPFEQNFETDSTAAWTVNLGPTDAQANFFFDYATVGIPPAPSGTGTRGMKLQANLSSGVFGGFSVSPTGQGFYGDVVLTFDWWANFNGPFPNGGNGSTNLSTFGIGTTGLAPQWQGAAHDCIWFGVTGDGGSFADYRVYSASQPSGYGPETGVFAAGYGVDARSNSHSYYASFGGIAAPPAQTALFPQQTGMTHVGAPAMAWHQVEISVSDATGQCLWKIDGLPIATVVAPGLLYGHNIFFGHSDVNDSSSSDSNDQALLFTLIDNIRVNSTMAGPPPGGPLLNVDISNLAGIGGGPPASSFGGAANQPGVWNAVTELGTGPVPLVDLNGQSTSVSLSRTGFVGSLSFNNPNTSGNYEKLLDDGHDIASSIYTFYGLNPGRYFVYTYAIAPDNQSYRTQVSVTGASGGGRTVGGPMPLDAMVHGVTHVIHEVTLTPGQPLSIELSLANLAATLNGIQITTGPLPPCSGDTNNDRIVNVSDLLTLLAAWGPVNPADPTPADFNGDNVVNVTDLLTLLANWGPCD